MSAAADFVCFAWGTGISSVRAQILLKVCVRRWKSSEMLRYPRRRLRSWRWLPITSRSQNPLWSRCAASTAPALSIHFVKRAF